MSTRELTPEEISTRQRLLCDVRDYVTDTSGLIDESRAVDLLRRLNLLKYEIDYLSEV